MNDTHKKFFSVIYDTMAKLTFPNCDVDTRIEDDRIITTVTPKEDKKNE